MPKINKIMKHQPKSRPELTPQVSKKECPQVRETVKVAILNNFPQPEDFLASFNHQASVKKYGKLTFEQVCTSKFVKLNELAAIYSPETPVFLLEAWINGLMLFLGFKNTLQDYQVQELAGYIYEEIHFLNIAELTLLFKTVSINTNSNFDEYIDKTTDRLLNLDLDSFVNSLNNETKIKIVKMTDR